MNKIFELFRKIFKRKIGKHLDVLSITFLVVLLVISGVLFINHKQKTVLDAVSEGEISSKIMEAGSPSPSNTLTPKTSYQPTPTTTSTQSSSINEDSQNTSDNDSSSSDNESDAQTQNSTTASPTQYLIPTATPVPTQEPSPTPDSRSFVRVQVWIYINQKQYPGQNRHITVTEYGSGNTISSGDTNDSGRWDSDKIAPNTEIVITETASGKTSQHNTGPNASLISVDFNIY